MGKIVNGKLLYSTGRSAQCDDLEGWDGGGLREVQEGGIYVYSWPIHIVVWKKATQH